MKLTIDLNDKEVEQLICSFLAGSMIMETDYPDFRAAQFTKPRSSNSVKFLEKHVRKSVQV